MMLAARRNNDKDPFLWCIGLKKSSMYQSSRPTTVGSPMPRIAPSASVASPDDLVMRALAILSEDNSTALEAKCVGLSRQPRVLNDPIQPIDPPRQPPILNHSTQSAELPLQRRVLSDGTVVPLPVRYFDAQCLLAMFSAELSSATWLLKGTALQAVPQDDKKALALLGCFEYRTTDIGP
jgi:hypothetical protein